MTLESDLKLHKREGNYYVVVGKIDGSTSLGSFGLPSNTDVHFDMGGVTSFSSHGLRDWLSVLQAQHIRPLYMNCSPAMVQQLNMVMDLLSNAVVLSFQVPTFCAKCGENKLLVLQSGVHYKPGEMCTFQPEKCLEPGCAIELDVMPDEYFFFVENLTP